MRVGLLGGSFNPAHSGHRRISLAALRALHLDEVWWLVSPGNPDKPPEQMARYSARLASARRMARHARIVVSDLEVRLGTVYTVDTVRAVTSRYPKHSFVWLMGADNLAGFSGWGGWRTIAQTVPIAAVARPGYNSRALRGPAMGWLRRGQRPAGQAAAWTTWSLPALVLLRFPADSSSATEFRAAHPEWLAGGG